MEKRHLSHLNGVFFFESMPTVFRLGLGIPLTPAESAVEECHRRSVCCTVSLFVLCLLCFALFCFFLILILLIVPTLAFLFLVKSIPALSDRFITTVDFADK